MKKIILFLIFAILSFLFVWCQNAEKGKNNSFSKETLNLFNNSEQFELLSLNPIFKENAKENFHGYEVLGKITVNRSTQIN